MIKIEKNLSDIPSSLRLPDDRCFNGRTHQPSETTHRRRMEVIDKGEYIYHRNYDSRYKQKDIKDALKDIYHNKCAFCERKIEQAHVEHYRPKKSYYCLAFSWDNLLLACSTCNQFKSDNFELEGGVCALDVSDDNIIKNINTISAGLDSLEKPKMVNPEVTNPLGEIKFQRNGNIESDNNCFSYTITTCKIDRIHLKDERRIILDIFKRDVESVFVENTSKSDQMAGLSTLVSKFKRDSKDDELPFLGFKKFAIENGWLSSLVREALG